MKKLGTLEALQAMLRAAGLGAKKVAANGWAAVVGYPRYKLVAGVRLERQDARRFRRGRAWVEGKLLRVERWKYLPATR